MLRLPEPPRRRQRQDDWRLRFGRGTRKPAGSGRSHATKSPGASTPGAQATIHFVMYVEDRNALVAWLRRQLIGPAGEESLRLSPLDRYPTGVLHPIDPGRSGIEPCQPPNEGARATESYYRFDVLTYDLRGPRGDSQERQRRSFRSPAILFPIPQRVNADTDRGSKLDLSKSDKPAQRHHVGTRLESASHEASSNTCRNRGRKLALRQFHGFIHAPGRLMAPI